MRNIMEPFETTINTEKPFETINNNDLYPFFLVFFLVYTKEYTMKGKLVAELSQALFDDHSEDARNLRNPEATKTWYLEAAKGGGGA